MKYDHLKCLKLHLKGRKLKEMANSDVTRTREYTSWSLLVCRMAHHLETLMFVCQDKMPTMYGRDLTGRPSRPGPQTELWGRRRTRSTSGSALAMAACGQDWADDHPVQSELLLEGGQMKEE